MKKIVGILALMFSIACRPCVEISSDSSGQWENILFTYRRPVPADYNWLLGLLYNPDNARFCYGSELSQEEVEQLTTGPLGYFRTLCLWTACEFPFLSKKLAGYKDLLIVEANEAKIGFVGVDAIKKSYDIDGKKRKIMLDVVINVEFWNQQYEIPVFQYMIQEIENDPAYESIEGIIVMANDNDYRKKEIIESTGLLNLLKLQNTFEGGAFVTKEFTACFYERIKGEN